MGCTSCGQTNYSPFNPYPKPNPCSPCNQGYDNCDDAVQIAYVPGTACTIGITYHCMTSTLSLKEGIQNCETDTRFVWNSDTGCIDYHSERYVNQMEGSYIQSVCASQIASAINLCELNDVADTACDPENCALLVYTKNTDCGENCKGVNDMWAPWTVKANLADYLTYVMGFNEEGCPVALDKPDTESEYWWAMWRGDNKFGYTQPTEVEELPKNEAGESLVISQNPDGSPVIGPAGFRDQYDAKECTYFDAAPGYAIADQGGNSICYYPFRQVCNIQLDIWVSAQKSATTLFNEHVATIHDTKFFPNVGEGFIDLPLHAVWKDNSSGAIMPVWIRIDANGRVLVSGEITTREASGRSRYICLGVDDTVAWNWKG